MTAYLKKLLQGNLKKFAAKIRWEFSKIFSGDFGKLLAVAGTVKIFHGKNTAKIRQNAGNDFDVI